MGSTILAYLITGQWRVAFLLPSLLAAMGTLWQVCVIFGLHWGLVPELMGVALLSAVIPLMLMPVLRRLVRLSPADSASIAAHYGSVSAGTFAVALAYVEARQLAVGSEVTLYLVAMELPAIMIAIALYRRYQGAAVKESTSKLWHETLTNRGVILLAGGVVIGALYGPFQGEEVTNLFTGAFKGVLALFLLEMGLTAAQTLRPMPWHHWRLVTFALVTPMVLSLMGIAVGALVGLPIGSVVILAALAASASYIAAPAAMRAAIPEANIGLAMLASLGITFPLNVMLGIPVYHRLIEWLLVS